MADTLQIGNVPAELHSVIAERARAAGLTISQYLLRRLIRIEGKPEIGDVLTRHWEKTAANKHAAAGTAAKILAEERDR